MPPSKKRRTAEAKPDEKVKRTKKEEQKCIDCPLFNSDGLHDTPFNELPLDPESIVKHLIDEHGLTGTAYPHGVGAAVEGLTLVSDTRGSFWKPMLIKFDGTYFIWHFCGGAALYDGGCPSCPGKKRYSGASNDGTFHSVVEAISTETTPEYQQEITFAREGHWQSYCGPISSVADNARPRFYDFPDACAFANPRGVGLVVPNHLYRSGSNTIPLRVEIHRIKNAPKPPRVGEGAACYN